MKIELLIFYLFLAKVPFVNEVTSELKKNYTKSAAGAGISQEYTNIKTATRRDMSVDSRPDGHFDITSSPIGSYRATKVPRFRTSTPHKVLAATTSNCSPQLFRKPEQLEQHTDTFTQYSKSGLTLSPLTHSREYSSPSKPVKRVEKVQVSTIFIMKLF